MKGEREPEHYELKTSWVLIIILICALIIFIIYARIKIAARDIRTLNTTIKIEQAEASLNHLITTHTYSL